MATYVYVLCVIGGLALGIAAAYVNALISRKSVGKNDMAAIMGTNFARMGIDVLTLGAAFLLCRRFELPLVAVLLSVAVGLTAAGMLFLKKIANEVASQDGAAKEDGGE